MAFQLQAKTVIESATLELSARELEDLAAARDPLDRILAFYEANVLADGGLGDDGAKRPEEVKVLDPVVRFLASIGSVVDQTGTIKPKRVLRRPKRNPSNGGTP